ncbi:MAG TPA: hypothetical protein VMT54_11075 [Candidatus Cybelea sp.]|nr:hypothetical protein [Candidatus Cybelea sp.]
MMMRLRPAALRDFDRSGLGVDSIEAWPAAGGGLLVGMAEPAFAGRAPLRPAVKTLFIRIDAGGAIALLLPYATLEEELGLCIRALVASELSLPESGIAILVSGDAVPRGFPALVDLGPRVEHSVRACAAVARDLLMAAAAELWGLRVELCRAAEGSVFGRSRDQIARYGELAADAAICDVPSAVRRCSDRCRGSGVLSRPDAG